MKKIFIDGKAGTTGLRIYQRLSIYSDIELITLSDSERKDTAARKRAVNQSDIVFLCLPDQASREAITLLDNPETIVLDTSTAHRTNPDWAYGFPELSNQHRDKIINSKRISVPGCHASGFIALIYPLVESGILPQSAYLSFHSLTGYSGGGKAMISEYEDSGRDNSLDSPRQYGLGQNHKHLIEVKTISKLDYLPHFSPIVSGFYSGMLVTVPLFKEQLIPGKTIEDVIDILKQKYQGPIVSYTDSLDVDGFIASNKLQGKDSMQITVAGNSDRILLLNVYDNLGKGASGAAIQCLNLILGKEETYSLEL
ncbi:MAG TPA: N-acetyl-gamma-glutamyl-phosphate reductase [Clostridiaceae bacterium]|nr:N-acetyl-gamma-glutamyl-phosphate reductase [Clostridiaceae bacterium]